MHTTRSSSFIFTSHSVAWQFCTALSILLFSLIHIFPMPMSVLKEYSFVFFFFFFFFWQVLACPLNAGPSFPMSHCASHSIWKEPSQATTTVPPWVPKQKRASFLVPYIGRGRGCSWPKAGRQPGGPSSHSVPFSAKDRENLLLPAAVEMPSNRQVYSRALHSALCRMAKDEGCGTARQELLGFRAPTSGAAQQLPGAGRASRSLD